MSFGRFSLCLLTIVILIAPVRAQEPNACLAAAKPSWTKSEIWAWAQICAGQPADFDARLPGTPIGNDLSLGFISAILFDPTVRGQVPHGGVHIAGAHFTDALALSYASLGFELALERSDFLGNVDLHGFSDTADVSFAGSRFTSLINLDGAKFGGNLAFNDGAEAAYLSMVRANIGGSANFDTLSIVRGLDLERINIAHNLSLRGVKLPGVDLLGASVAGDVTFRDAKISGWAWLENLNVGSDLFMEKMHLARTDLPGASIGGNLVMTGSEVAGPLNMKGIKIGGDLSMDGAAKFQSIALPDADVAYNLRLGNAHVAGPLSLPGAHIGHLLALGPLAVFDGEVAVQYTHIDGAAVLSQSHFAKDVDFDGTVIGQSLIIANDASIAGSLRVTFAHIGANVDFTAGSFNSVDLTGTTIGAEIRLASKGYASIAWGPKARLTLRNVSAKALQDLPNAWPTELDLEGFTYQQLGGYREAGGTEDVAARGAQSFIDWLAKQPQYSPQPYRTLADVLRNSGYADKAKQVLYAGSMRDWQGSSGFAWLWQTMRWAIIGFGLYPQRSALWLLVLVPLGAIVFGYDPAVRLRAMRPLDRLVYSFDALLPFVTLRIEHNAFDLQSWPKYYLYFHKVMGYVLIAFLLAALTGTS
jgi:uncharacterized protein YjbI with pentapeptide repeats